MKITIPARRHQERLARMKALASNTVWSPNPSAIHRLGRGDGQREACAGTGRRHQDARSASHAPRLQAAPVRRAAPMLATSWRIAHTASWTMHGRRGQRGLTRGLLLARVQRRPLGRDVIRRLSSLKLNAHPRRVAHRLRGAAACHACKIRSLECRVCTATPIVLKRQPNHSGAH